MRNKVVAVVVFLSLLWIGTSWADAPQLINFQGRLTDSLGNVVSDGSYSIRFRIYDDSLAGNVLWEETSPVQINKGLFTVLLGSTSAIPESSFYSANRWLGIKVGANPEIAPRQRLGSVGYSFQSGQWSSAGNNIYRDSGNVGIGAVPPPDVRLYANDLKGDPTSAGGVSGQAQNTSSGHAYGVSGYANANSGNAYGGYFSGSSSGGSGYGVYGTGNTYGIYGSGFFGLYGSASGSGYGVYGTSPSGDGVYGSGGNAGVAGYSVLVGVDGQGGNYGVTGTSSSGTGVYGASTNSYGVYAASTNGYGVYATGGPNGVVASANSGAGVSATSANGPGVVASGFTNGVEATGGSRGVYAIGNNYGVVGGSTSGTGLYGSGGTFGVYGVATSNVFPAYGIYGYNNGSQPTTYAGFFDGSVKITNLLEVNGFIYKYGGGFKIDDPTDPANKYLYHSFVESPDMKNIYDGVVTTDAKGEATVTLPDWFGALNKDFRYQLTALGAPGPNLYIAQEISGNQFKIAGGTAGMKVSWQVTGIRKDPYAEAHRILVEVAKTGKEKGRYLHPEEYGAPPSLGMHYEEEQRMAAERKQMEEQKVKMEQESLSPKK